MIGAADGIGCVAFCTARSLIDFPGILRVTARLGGILHKKIAILQSQGNFTMYSSGGWRIHSIDLTGDPGWIIRDGFPKEGQAVGGDPMHETQAIPCDASQTLQDSVFD